MEYKKPQAAIVRRIFAEFVAGVSPKAIAKALNAEGIPGPAGAAWSPSTIHGNPKRGTGILNNELYVGRLVWNRQRFVKDPRYRQAPGAAKPRSRPKRSCASASTTSNFFAKAARRIAGAAPEHGRHIPPEGADARGWAAT